MSTYLALILVVLHMVACSGGTSTGNPGGVERTDRETKPLADDDAGEISNELSWGLFEFHVCEQLRVCFPAVVDNSCEDTLKNAKGWNVHFQRGEASQSLSNFYEFDFESKDDCIHSIKNSVCHSSENPVEESAAVFSTLNCKLIDDLQ